MTSSHCSCRTTKRLTSRKCCLSFIYSKSHYFALIFGTETPFRDDARWSFLQPFSSSGKPLPREVIFSQVLKDPDFSRFIAQMVPDALDHNVIHRPLLTFYMTVTLNFFSQAKELDHTTIAYILPTLLRHLDVPNIKLQKDCIVRYSLMHRR